MASKPQRTIWFPCILCHATKIGIAVVFFTVFMGMYGLTWQTLAVLAAPNPTNEFIIEEAGPSWEGMYDSNQAIIRANKIHIPLDQPIPLWVAPANGPYRFQISNQTNTLWVGANTADIYSGQCTEFCIKHARISFGSVAGPQEVPLDGSKQPCHPAVAPVDSEASDSL